MLLLSGCGHGEFGFVRAIAFNEDDSFGETLQTCDGLKLILEVDGKRTQSPVVSAGQSWSQEFMGPFAAEAPYVAEAYCYRESESAGYIKVEGNLGLGTSLPEAITAYPPSSEPGCELGSQKEEPSPCIFQSLY